MVPCGRWGMAISSYSCCIIHVFARVTATTTLLISFLECMENAWIIYSFNVIEDNWLKSWWWVKDGWRIHRISLFSILFLIRLTSINCLKWINNHRCHLYPLNIIWWVCPSNCPKWAQDFWSFLKVIWVHLSLFWKWQQSDSYETTSLSTAERLTKPTTDTILHITGNIENKQHRPTPWRRYVWIDK